MDKTAAEKDTNKDKIDARSRADNAGPTEKKGDDRPVEARTVQVDNDKESRERQIKQREESLGKLNDANQEGHEKNMQRAEDEAKLIEEASKNTIVSGKEDNRNTPKVNPDGSKNWS